ncbi:lignin-forming anionic peroxidase-like [Bidens hawaiensis]|uniref:lignin-forming anionic peroxidase-like n=1 Tax=Bidens hawaiensis TaxID=980011 RepID=UPI00404AD9B6
MASPIIIKAVFFILVLSITCNTPCEAQLSSTFYDTSCPNALRTIQTAIRTAISRERRMAASILRLHFHDCFVQGCDASILLDDGPTIVSEKNALPNMGSVRGYEVIEATKSEVEKLCPGVVSCADSVAAHYLCPSVLRRSHLSDTEPPPVVAVPPPSIGDAVAGVQLDIDCVI